MSQSGLIFTVQKPLHCIVTPCAQGEPQDQDSVELFATWNQWFCQTLRVDSCEDQEGYYECSGVQCS